MDECLKVDSEKFLEKSDQNFEQILREILSDASWTKCDEDKNFWASIILWKDLQKVVDEKLKWFLKSMNQKGPSMEYQSY